MERDKVDIRIKDTGLFSYASLQGFVRRLSFLLKAAIEEGEIDDSLLEVV